VESEVLQRSPTEKSHKRTHITLKRVNTVLVSDTENEVTKLNALFFFPSYTVVFFVLLYIIIVN